MENPKTKETFDFLKEKCRQVHYGEWEVKLIIYDGALVGLDQLREPVVKFRAKAKGAVEQDL